MKTNSTLTGFYPKSVFTLIVAVLLWTAGAAQVNDLCTNATPVASGATCGTSTVSGTVTGSTYTAGPAISCGTPTYDVWYTFTAQSKNPTFTFNNPGGAINVPRIQIFSGTCGALANVYCNTMAVASTAAMNLTVGTSYTFRIFSVTGPVPTGTAGDFTFCITDPPPPVNDNHTTPINLVSGTTCVNTSGSVANANSSPLAGDPQINTGYDVWYTFTAKTPNPIINVSGIGANFTGARVQVLQGTFGSFVSKFTGTVAQALTTAYSLTVDTVYYVRVFSNVVPPPANTANFDICITDYPTPVNDTYLTAAPIGSAATCGGVTSGSIANANQTTGDLAINTPGSGDVWYRFVALSANPIITINNYGTGYTAAAARAQVLEGSYPNFVNKFAGTHAALGTTSLTLTVGTTYYLRLFVNTATVPFSNATFDICITDPPAPVNDDISNAIMLTSGATCVSPTGLNIGNATYNPANAPVGCATGSRYDVWFSFVAQRTNPIIRFTAANTAFNTPRIQVFSGVPGSLVSVGCNGTNYNPQNYTIGQTYYIQLYSASGTVIPNQFNGGYTICVEDPALPVNEDCETATILTQQANGACTNVNGNLGNAQPAVSAVPGACGNPNSPDLWYKFAATSPYPQVNVTGGAGLAAAGLRVQLFTGACGSLNPLVCNRAYTNSVSSFPPSTPVAIGDTIWVRITSDGGVPTSGVWNTTICVTTPVNPLVHVGKTYVNVTKGAGGGTIEPGDTLEMRAVLNVRNNVMFNAVYQDVVPTNTTYIPGTLRILTNEGKIFRQWTDAFDSDPATISGSAVTINLGNGATSTGGGFIRTSDRPSAGSQLIMVVSFSIRVNSVAYGTQIPMGGGSISFTQPDGTANVINYQPTSATVYPNYGICTNTIGSNGIVSEFGGTFGNGDLKDRIASNKVPANYGYVTFGSNAPGDYFYGVSNNSSTTTVSTNPAEPYGSPSRVFGHWDIIGDHTGATNQLAGNAPVAAGTPGGYMVVINAAYRADTAFQDTVRNLCPNTSYEYSAWFRNICRTCGTDSFGVNYVNYPIQPADMSGVKPNLTFNINGQDYYTTGNIDYTNQWIKKGFTYRTGPGETEMIINIRNNAPGGGGNDWAIDDIGVATCSPTLVLNPSTPTVNVCYGDGQSLSAEVISYYDNFTHYIWERSVDSGATWAITSFTGVAAPAFNGSEYAYTATGPSLIGDSTTHNNQFRLRVASSASNLADVDCSFRATRTIVVLVHNCMYVLKTKVLSLSGSIQQSLGTLNWTTSSEEAGVTYTIERSLDGTKYRPIGVVNGRAANGFGDKYQFTDPVALKAPTYYRITVTENGKTQYTKVVLLSPVTVAFDVKNVLSPFDNQLSFDVIAPADGTVKLSILDNFGRVVKSFNQQVYHGVTPVKTSQHGAIANGVYVLKAEFGNTMIIKRMVKVNK